MGMKRAGVTYSFFLALSVAALSLPGHWSASGEGPYVVSRTGEPFRWRTNPVGYTPDRGPLGPWDNATAREMLRLAFSQWEDVETANIRFQERGQLGIDVTGGNVMEFLNRPMRGVSPFIFDHDGSVMDALFGQGASQDIIGFAYPFWNSLPIRGDFREGIGGFNGLFVGQRIPSDSFRSTLVHEIGHFIGLGHTQLNVRQAFDGFEANDNAVPIMFPFLLTGWQARLHPEDVAYVSYLYPEVSFATDTGVIEGRVLMPNGQAGFQGANVSAYRVNEPLVGYSAVSGDLFTGTWRPLNGNGSFDPALRGFYRIVGLSPGKYWLEVEPVQPEFSGGSVVGPLDPPARLVGGREFYSGAAESNRDNARLRVLVKVRAGEVTHGVDVILNGEPPDNDLCRHAATILGPVFVDTIATEDAAAEDDDPRHSCTLRQDSNSVWYSYSPPRPGIVIASTAGTDYKTVLSAYRGTCGEMTEVACNSNTDDDNLDARIIFGALDQRPYLIEVADADDQVGGGVLRFSFQYIPEVLVHEREPNETLEQAQAVGNPGAVQGDIGAQDAGQVQVTLNGRVERIEDLYTFSVSGGSKVQINLSGERFGSVVDMVLFVVGDGGPTIVGNGSRGESSSIGPIDLNPGRYFVGLSVSDSETGSPRTEYILAINSY